MNNTQRAVLIRRFGGAEAAEVAGIDIPEPGEGQVLILAADGVITGTTSPDILARKPANRRGLWFMNKPDPVLLETLAKEVASGTLQSRIGGIVGFADLPDAIERHRTASRTGKVVADFSR